jgi:hypothetical protein
MFNTSNLLSTKTKNTSVASQVGEPAIIFHPIQGEKRKTTKYEINAPLLKELGFNMEENVERYVSFFSIAETVETEEEGITKEIINIYIVNTEKYIETLDSQEEIELVRKESIKINKGLSINNKSSYLALLSTLNSETEITEKVEFPVKFIEDNGIKAALILNEEKPESSEEITTEISVPEEKVETEEVETTEEFNY